MNSDHAPVARRTVFASRTARRWICRIRASCCPGLDDRVATPRASCRTNEATTATNGDWRIGRALGVSCSATASGRAIPSAGTGRRPDHPRRLTGAGGRRSRCRRRTPLGTLPNHHASSLRLPVLPLTPCHCDPPADTGGAHVHALRSPTSGLTTASPNTPLGSTHTDRRTLTPTGRAHCWSACAGPRVTGSRDCRRHHHHRRRHRPRTHRPDHRSSHYWCVNCQTTLAVADRC